MKVKDFMHKPTVTITENETIQKAAELIYNFRFGGIPVVNRKKLVGIITESDILHKLFPSINEFIDDASHSRDFEEMETNINNLVSKKISTIMNKKMTVVHPDMPIMKAQSIMLLRDFSRLPVVNDEGDLVGIISQGDVFRALVATEIPHNSAQEFRDWLSYHYDMVVTWKTRLGAEIPSLLSLFKKHDIVSVVDIMTGTGEHPIQLAKHGYNVTGIDDSHRMYKVARKKYGSLSEELQERISFKHGTYVEKLSEQKGEFDAAILMGNSLPYMADEWRNVVAATSKSLKQKNSIMVLQIRNLELNFQMNQRLEEFNIAQSRVSDEGEYAFIVFYTPPQGRSRNLTATMAVLSYDGTKWSHAGVNSTPIADIRRKNMQSVLEKLGFKKVSFFGSDYGQPLFQKKFEPLKDYWLNVVAER